MTSRPLASTLGTNVNATSEAAYKGAHKGYPIGDVDLPPDRRKAVALRLAEINQHFGDRDHLLPGSGPTIRVLFLT